MAFLFGSSREERAHVAQVLRSLGPCSVAGLAAALSWSERRTEKAVRELVHDGLKGLRYDPIRRTVALPVAASVLPTPDARGTANVPEPGASAGPRALPPAPGRAPKGWPGTPKCPGCGAGMEPTATGEGLVCPRCGRLALGRRASSPPLPGGGTPALPEATSSPTARPAQGPGPVGTLDRKSQELFAAWVTDRPIPCPKCRRALQHRGVGSYVCASCGETVLFRDDGRIERSVPAPPAA